jgi:hypothetical protein
MFSDWLAVYAVSGLVSIIYCLKCGAILGIVPAREQLIEDISERVKAKLGNG